MKLPPCALSLKNRGSCDVMMILRGMPYDRVVLVN